MSSDEDQSERSLKKFEPFSPVKNYATGEKQFKLTFEKIRYEVKVKVSKK